MNKSGSNVASLIAQLRSKMNDFVLARLADEGIRDLAPSHGAILVVLYHGGPQPMTALSEKVNRGKSTTTGLISKLEAKGYVRREPDSEDSRVVMVHLTERGFRFRPVFEKISSELVQKVWGDTSKIDREKIMADLLSMLDRF